MKNRILAFLLLSGLLLSAGTTLAKSYKSYKDVPVPPILWEPQKFTEFKLDNGIAGLVVEDHEVQITNFYLLFPAPPDSKEKLGLADLTAWTLRNGGTTNITPDSLNAIIEYKAGYIGVNGGDNYVSVWGNCLSEDLPLFLSLTSDLILHPAYPQDRIDLHKGSMIEDIKRKNEEPRGIARRELYGILYHDHPWGEEATEATVNAITRDDLLAYHSLVYRADGLVIGFSGDLTPDNARKLTEQSFGSLKKGGPDIAKLPDVKEIPKAGVYYAYKDINQAFISVGHLSISYDDPRRHAADVMNYILGGGGFTSILMKKIRVGAGLTYGVGSSISMPVEAKGSFRASASTRLDQSGRSLAMLLDEIRNYAKDGPTEADFEQAKQAFLNSYVWRFESSEDVLGQVVYDKWRGLPLDTPQRDLDAYQKLTYDEVKKAAQELIKPDSLVVVVVGNKDKMDRKLEDFGEVHTIDLNKQ